MSIPGYNYDDPDNIAAIGAPLHREMHSWFLPLVTEIVNGGTFSDTESMMTDLAIQMGELFGWRSLEHWPKHLLSHHLKRHGMDNDTAYEWGVDFENYINAVAPKPNYLRDAHTYASFHMRGLIARPKMLETLLVETLQDMQEPATVNPAARIMATARLDGILHTIAYMQGGMFASDWLEQAVLCAAMTAGMSDEDTERVTSMAEETTAFVIDQEEA